MQKAELDLPTFGCKKAAFCNVVGNSGREALLISDIIYTNYIILYYIILYHGFKGVGRKVMLALFLQLNSKGSGMNRAKYEPIASWLSFKSSDSIICASEWA